MRLYRGFLPTLLVLLAALLLTACGPRATPGPSGTGTPAPTTAPVLTPTPTPTPTPATTPVPATPWTPPSGSLNITDYFPPGPGRELVITVCQNCHNLVRLLVARKSPQAWEGFVMGHHEAELLSEDTKRLVIAYVTANFGPDDPVPQIPTELIWGGPSGGDV